MSVLRRQPTQRKAGPGGVGGQLENDRAAGSESGRELGDVDLVRVVPRRDRRDHTDRLTLDPPVARPGHRRGDTELLVPLVALRQVCVERQDFDRLAQLRTTHQHPRSAHLCHRDVGELLLVVQDRLVQLALAADPQLHVGGPLGVVECTSGRGDRTLDVGPRCVRGDADDLSLTGLMFS